MSKRDKDEANDVEMGEETMVLKPEQNPKTKIDLSLVWKKAPRLTGKPGVIYLDKNNPKHREIFGEDR